MCEQVRTVNAVELQKYLSTLDESVMVKVEDTLIRYLGIKDVVRLEDLSTKKALENIESIIDKMIEKKLEGVKRANKVSTEDISIIVDRVSDKLNSKFNDMFGDETEEDMSSTLKCSVSDDVNSNTTKEESSNDKCLSSNTNVKKGKIHTKEEATEFLNDFDNMSSEEVARKWGYSSGKSARQQKYYYLRKYLEK